MRRLLQRANDQTVANAGRLVGAGSP
jgi:hypothetical protein